MLLPNWTYILVVILWNSQTQQKQLNLMPLHSYMIASHCEIKNDNIVGKAHTSYNIPKTTLYFSYLFIYLSYNDPNVTGDLDKQMIIVEVLV